MKPSRIFDIHTHLFNARYIPLASIIANAMGVDNSTLANLVARLLERLTGSSYVESASNTASLKGASSLNISSGKVAEDENEARITALWEITRYELLSANGKLSVMEDGNANLALVSAKNVILHDDLVDIIAQLEEEVRKWDTDPSPLLVMPIQDLESFLEKAEKVVRKALRKVVSLMIPNAWGEVENYLKFFLTMLSSEDKIFERLSQSYGDYLPSMQFLHFMMDMQMAYKFEKPPYYDFYPEQINRMQWLQQKNPGRIFGFSAFDPRRENWRERAKYALKAGFIGFKFYPALGYKPSENIDTDIQSRVDEFFDFCVENDVAIFVHCTPQGFQTRHKEGANAHPKYWIPVLKNRPKLRLCFGHAGGGRMTNGDVASPGWLSASDDEWKSANNFSRIVSEICTQYENVYCEFGYITEIFESDKRKVFVDNLSRAIAQNNMGGSYPFLKKVAYGSDWHMPDMIDRTKEYLEIFIEIFSASEFQVGIEDFFWGNAYKFLQLPRMG